MNGARIQSPRRQRLPLFKVYCGAGGGGAGRVMLCHVGCNMDVVREVLTILTVSLLFDFCLSHPSPLLSFPLHINVIVALFFLIVLDISRYYRGIPYTFYFSRLPLFHIFMVFIIPKFVVFNY